MAPRDALPPDKRIRPEAASGGHIGVGATAYGAAAPRLLDNGYAPIPIVPGTKRPALSRWTEVAIDEAAVTRWSRQYPDHGIGLRTGTLVGLDVDILDPDLAHAVAALVAARLGSTLVRVGLWPKRLLIYRTDRPFAKMSVPGVEVLGLGQQFVAFGIHPAIGLPYHWPEGDTPLEVPFDRLPLVDAAICEELLAEAAALLPEPRRISSVPRSAKTTERRPSARRAAPPGSAAPVRDPDGRVTDGRDSWLSTIAFHAVRDAVVRGEPPDAAALTATTWDRFAANTDLQRPRKDGEGRYSPADAARKVADKLRLLAEGRLPAREPPAVEADYRAPTMSANDARRALDQVLQDACREIEAWYADTTRDAPCIGIKATVGLGKSVAARRHLLTLRQRLVAFGAPSRIVVFTPSHALAEEVAAAWRSDGVKVAVLRGYEARHPATRTPMCGDIDAVRAAVKAGFDIHSTACLGAAGHRCLLIDGCLKQRNRIEVETAEVVIAAYDALYSGLAIDPASIGVMLIDEGCWRRAEDRIVGTWDANVPHEIMRGVRSRQREERDVGDAADLLELRRRARAAFAANGLGPVRTDELRRTGLTGADCVHAARLEERAMRDPGLYPGIPADERAKAMIQAEANERARFRLAAWRAMADQVSGLTDGGLQVRAISPSTVQIEVSGARSIHPNLRGKPILHLDATLRPELARMVLPRLAVQEIDAAAPQMSLRLVAGPFGKSGLCPDPRAGAEENQRRASRLAECVDYVRWQVKRLSGDVLVVTYKDSEAAFSNIPGVEVAHFNAIAGLDLYRDVAALIVIGRPLPRDTELDPIAAAFFGHAPAGGYRKALRGVRMRDGSSRSVRVIEHEDEHAELLRAAICDDELVQAIGRGRGINRTTADPLEGHVLADVALPLVHDRLLAWDTVAPDIVQRMLLAGVAVDSPADAALLYPALLAGPEQAKKAFGRDGFKGQNPIRNIHREMSLKRAAYRRPGPGRSWQTAYWIAGNADAARKTLMDALGTLAEWVPDP